MKEILADTLNRDKENVIMRLFKILSIICFVTTSKDNEPIIPKTTYIPKRQKLILLFSTSESSEKYQNQPRSFKKHSVWMDKIDSHVHLIFEMITHQNELEINI